MKLCQPHSLFSFLSSATTAAAARSALDCQHACHDPTNRLCWEGTNTRPVYTGPRVGYTGILQATMWISLNSICAPELHRALLCRAVCHPGAGIKCTSIHLRGGASQGCWVSLPENGMRVVAGNIPWIKVRRCQLCESQKPVPSSLPSSAHSVWLFQVPDSGHWQI